MPGIIAPSPGAHVCFQCFFQNGLNGVPIGILKDGMVHELKVFESLERWLVLNHKSGFRWVLPGVQEQQRWMECGSYQSLVREGAYSIQQCGIRVGQMRFRPAEHVKLICGAWHEHQTFHDLV